MQDITVTELKKTCLWAAFSKPSVERVKDRTRLAAKGYAGKQASVLLRPVKEFTRAASSSPHPNLAIALPPSLPDLQLATTLATVFDWK